MKVSAKKTKICYRCKKRLPIGKFIKCKSGINKGYFMSYCYPCQKSYQKEHGDQNPWRKTYIHIRERVTNPKHHGYERYKKIKILISKNDLEFLWFRDKAWLLEKPSIDRRDSKGDYSLENCRYIEMRENSRLGGLKRKKDYINLTKRKGLI